MFAAMRCRTALDYQRAVGEGDIETVKEEILFWASNLTIFAAMGAPIVTRDIRQALRQLQVNAHPDIPANDTRTFSAVCLRRGGNSAAAPAGIASAIRQVQGR